MLQCWCWPIILPIPRITWSPLRPPQAPPTTLFQSSQEAPSAPLAHQSAAQCKTIVTLLSAVRTRWQRCRKMGCLPRKPTRCKILAGPQQVKFRIFSAQKTRKISMWRWESNRSRDIWCAWISPKIAPQTRLLPSKWLYTTQENSKPNSVPFQSSRTKTTGCSFQRTNPLNLSSCSRSTWVNLTSENALEPITENL